MNNRKQAEQIMSLNKKTNDGRGSSEADSIARLLMRGSREAAINVWRKYSDKIRQYPDMFQLLTDLLGEAVESDRPASEAVRALALACRRFSDGTGSANSVDAAIEKWNRATYKI